MKYSLEVVVRILLEERTSSEVFQLDKENPGRPIRQRMTQDIGTVQSIQQHQSVLLLRVEMDMLVLQDILRPMFVHRPCVAKTLLWILRSPVQEPLVIRNLSHSVMQAK